MVVQLSKQQGHPLYIDLRDVLLERFSRLSYYAPLPSEREICEDYKVSRSTVRRALELLEREGAVETVHGKGSFYIGLNRTFDNSKTFSQREISFVDQVTAQGGIPTSKVLMQDVRPADEELAEQLNIAKGDMVFCLERLRYIDGNLFQTNSSRIALSRCPDLEKMDFSGSVSLHHTLEDYGLIPSRAEKIIEIAFANQYDALKLEIEPRDPVTVTYTLTYDQYDKLLEYAVTKSSAYKTRLEMTVVREKGIA